LHQKSRHFTVRGFLFFWAIDWGHLIHPPAPL
jgi:hypothetical protein